MSTMYKYLLPFILIVMVSCTGEEEAELDNEILETSDFTGNIDRDALVGKWKLSKLMADRPVDLNGDDVESKNILAETTCFKTTGVVFNDNGKVSTTNSKLDFNSGENEEEFTCSPKDRLDRGTWDIERNPEGDKLILNLKIDGKIYTDSKHITQQPTTFSMEVSKMESDQYVEDPGDTQASKIRILELEYSKQ